MPILNNCCCCCSTRTGSLYVGIVTLVASNLGALGMIGVLVAYDDIAQAIREDQASGDNTEEFISFMHIVSIVSLVLFLIGLVVAGLLIYGIVKIKSTPMIPYLIFGLFALVLGIILDTLTITKGGNTIGAIAAMVLSTLVGTYFLLVVFSHYQEVKEQHKINWPPMLTKI